MADLANKPAFPLESPVAGGGGGGSITHFGMTLREYYAGEALKSIISATADSRMVRAMAVGEKFGSFEGDAAVAWADATIAALEADDG